MQHNDFPVTLYHNPKCGTSRNVLALLQAAGYEPCVVEYLKTGWTEAQLRDIAARSGQSLHKFLRVNGTAAEALGLTAETTTEGTLLAAMLSDPVLVNRPIVVTPKGARLCRPAEMVLELLND